jgi:hypothetical protein
MKVGQMLPTTLMAAIPSRGSQKTLKISKNVAKCGSSIQPL